MASPKNWERQQHNEYEESPYIWEHKSGEERVLVTRRSWLYERTKDWIVEQRNIKHMTSSELGVSSSKEEARKIAVKRMRENQEGFDTTTKDR